MKQVSAKTVQAIALYRQWSDAWTVADQLERDLRDAVNTIPDEEIGIYLRETHEEEEMERRRSHAHYFRVDP